MLQYLQLREVHSCLLFGDIAVAEVKLKKIEEDASLGDNAANPGWLQQWACAVQAMYLFATGAYREAAAGALKAAQQIASVPPPEYPHGMDRQQLKLLAIRRYSTMVPRTQLLRPSNTPKL